MVDTSSRSQPKSIVALVISVAVVLLASVIGGLASASSAADYGRLEQPPWAPPSWVFGPVWTALYAMMALAAWLVWRSGPWSQTRAALTAYGVQLVLNAAWTPLFFGLGWRGVALVDLTVLLAVLITTVVLFWRRSVAAGALLVPYLAWSAFAWSLNLAVWQLNA